MNGSQIKQVIVRFLVVCTTVLCSNLSTALSQQGQTKPQDKVAAKVPFIRTWTATSSTAMGITGDVQTTPGHLVLAKHDVALSRGRSLMGQDLRNAAALFPVEVKPDTTAVLYRVHVPAAQKFKNGNTLCGAQETAWMLIVENHAELNLAAFSGTAEPNLEPKVINNSTAFCGTMSYISK